MKAKELIRQLESFGGDTEVMFTFNYGDHSNTEVSEPIKFIAEGRVRWSEYHTAYAVLAEEDCGIYRDVILLQ